MDEQSNTVMLSSEDRDRMNRLYEEVHGRLHEMALITARVLGVPAEDIGGVRLDSASQSAPSSSGELTPRARPIRFEGIEFIYQDGQCVGIYDHDAGVCLPC
jgi:hypothetical protein